MPLAALCSLIQAASDPQKTAAPPPTGFGDIAFLGVALVGIMWFVVIRPANRERKKQAAMMSQLKKGDRVVLTSGLIAHIAALSEREVVVKVDDKNPLRMRFQKAAVQSILESDDGPPAETAEAESK